MDVIPAVDLSGGRVVRLLQGDYGRVTGFDETPDEAADRFALAGAGMAARDRPRRGARRRAQPRARRRARAPGAAARGHARPGRRRLPLAPTQVEAALAAGVQRVLIGTLAARDPDAVAALAAEHGPRICVCADALDGTRARGGLARGRGRVGEPRSSSASRRAASARSWSRRSSATARSPGPTCGCSPGVRAVTDGVLLAAGGFAALEHIAAARDAGCDGAVVGRALYDGSLNLREALTVARARSKGHLQCSAGRMAPIVPPDGGRPRPAEVAGGRCSFSMTIDRVIRRRILLGFLVAASFGLLTAWYREVDNGPLHRAQGSVADAAVPLSAAVQRVSRPFRDLWDWSRGLANARDEAQRLQAINQQQAVEVAPPAAAARRQRPTTARCSASPRTRGSRACSRTSRRSAPT